MIRNGLEVLKLEIKDAPESPGIYKMLDERGEYLYIGKARNIAKRIIWYTKLYQLPYRLQHMVSLINKVEFLVTSNEAEALILEANLIHNLQPKFNILLKDDKFFSYICFEMQHDFPRVIKFRGKKKTENYYFGPFFSASDVKNAIDEIQKIFQIRPCSDNYFASRTRPCLQYQIKRCSAPCVAKISKQDYGDIINSALDFLRGKNTKIQDILKSKMEAASQSLEYELAAQYRDRIQMLSRLQSKNAMLFDNNISNADVIAHYLDEYGNLSVIILMIRNSHSHGSTSYLFWNILEKCSSIAEALESIIMQIYCNLNAPAKILIDIDMSNSLISKALSTSKGQEIMIERCLNSEIITFLHENAKNHLVLERKKKMRHEEMLIKIASFFHLRPPINRIEVYDNSHLQGSNAVGCYIVAGNQGFMKDQYRIFKIKSNENKVMGGDDYEMLRQTLRRRLDRLTNDNRPDLILIDGGQGHFSVATEIIDGVIPFVCMAKGEDRNAGREYFYTNFAEPFQLPPHDPLLVYLQGLRDEAHRFAINTHRKMRSKSMNYSVLDQIKGLGPKRKRDLLLHFGSVEAIKYANIEDIARISGIGRKIAVNVLHFVKGS